MFCLLLLFASATFASATFAQQPLPSDDLAKVRAAESARIAAIEKVYGAVVAIYGNDRGGGGSGVIYDPAGYALTNYHVVAGAGVEGWGGLADGKLYRWKLIGMDPGGDVAIIKLTGKDSFPVAPLGDSNAVRVGDFTMAMGNPFVLAEDQRPTVTLGIVSGIKRYQPGEGGATMLVYGNCIQVDSSINPGNSGGPLFNMAGEVIGINGRGSFKERGRVNVGVGYAISMDQIKNFIPDLLATKTALHGTLDATFAKRGGQVVCERINLDSKIAELGLALGDRLISFNGEPIDDVNEYTNLVSTIPAGWPVEVTFSREGRQKTVWLRLVALPYPKQPKRAEPKKPDESKRGPRAPEPDAPAPKVPDVPIPQIPGRPNQPPQPKLPDTEPGKIGDMVVNQGEFRRIAAAWRKTSAIDAVPAAIETSGEIQRQGAAAGRFRALIAGDSRFVVEYELDGQSHAAAFDGEKYATRVNRSSQTAATPEDVIDDPLFASALSLARLFKEESLSKNVKHYELQGSDRAAGQRASRLRVSFAQGEDLFLWTSLFDEAGQPATRLLKTAAGDGDPIDPAVTYHDYAAVAGVLWPHRLRVVSGLAEKEQYQVIINQTRAEPSISSDAFKLPKGQ